MSDTQTYKTTTFTGPECFAVVRALRGRLLSLEKQLRTADATGDTDMLPYILAQQGVVQRALAIMEATPLVLGAKGL